MKEKHLPYFEVLDSFASKDCPLCFLVTNRIQKFFEHLLYENINDPGFRKFFRESHGFCNYHSYQFLDHNDGMAISLTHRDLLRDIIEQIENKDFKALFKHSKKCLICEMIVEQELRYASLIVEYLKEEEFSNRLLSSEGFCLPHCLILFHQRKKLPAWLLEFQLSKFKTLLEKTEKYLDSCNFSLGEERPVLQEDEKLIWKKLVKKLVGFPGRVFSPE